MPQIKLVGPIVALLVSLPAATPALPAAGFVAPGELEAGDRCVGKTVFAGTQVESFDLTILGVVPGLSPGGHLILARADDERLERTGILQGMSGSPVYLEGRLVGAIAGTWPFAEEPIAAVTPIGEMLPAMTALEEPRRGGAGGPAIPGSALSPGDARWTSRAHWVARAAGVAGSDAPGAGPAALGAYAGGDVARLGLPLAVSSADERLVSRLAAILGPSGLVPVTAPSGTADVEVGALEPGSSVGVQLLGGDLSMAAVGTVTLREGDRILAFGHPLFNSGSIDMPMIGAYVHALMPLQLASFKFASAGDVVGAVLEDQRRAIAGRIGEVARTTPLRVQVRAHGAPEPKRYSFDVVRARRLAAFFAATAVAEAVSEAAQSVGAASITLRATVSTSRGDIEYENTFFTEDPMFGAGGELGTLLDLIYDNGLEEIEPTEVAVDVAIRKGVWRTEIARVEVDRSVYRPGDPVRVAMTLRDWQGPERRAEIELALPASLSDGELRLKVGGASAFHQWEADRLGDGLRPRSYRQLLDLIDRSRPGNTIVAQIVRPDGGLSLSGSEMREIPGRAALVLLTSATSGAVDQADGLVVAERELAVAHEVQGDHEIVIHVRSDR
jgi:hypothetical protein